MKLEVKNLVKKFKSTLAVNNISFDIEKNKTLGLLGPNGCGKTTSIGMMLGLITPSSGQIFINGVELTPKNRINLLSLMNFASPYIELPKKLTVKQNLEVYARLYGVKKIEERISEMIEGLNLQNFLKIKTGELSSGQKNRVSLAKSLINKPKLLFLDEPTSSLDPDVGDFVRQYIEKYKKYNELTILLASHNMREVERLCDKVVMMKNGQIVDSGTCDELIKKHGRKNLEETFLKIARSKNTNELE
jgi:ABC-2 type transport system ATP-binding protein|tara:strand:- start:3216 stop:3956 length:741 start_codon:yes stop_codon:yes gene_type:complete